MSAQANSSEPLRLIPQLEKDGQVHATVPFSWCLTEAGKAELAEREVNDPHVLMVVENNGEEMARYLVPLDAPLQHVTFGRPGRNTIHATVVSKSKSVLGFRRKFRKQVGGILGWKMPETQKIEAQCQALSSEIRALELRIESRIEESDEEREVRLALQSDLEQFGERFGRALESHSHLRSELRGTRQIQEWLEELGGNLESLGGQVSEQEDKAAFDAIVAQRDDLARQLEELGKKLDETRQAEKPVYYLEGLPYMSDFSRLPSETQLAVDVPEEMYAKRSFLPVRMLAALYPSKRKPQDQCENRRRALLVTCALPFVLPLAPLALGAFLLLESVNLLVIGFLLLLGFRGVNAGPLRHPLTEPPWEAWDHLRPSVWFDKETVDGDGSSRFDYSYESRPIQFWIANPPVLVVVSALVFGISAIFGSLLAVLQAVAYAVVILAALVVLATIISKIPTDPIERWIDRRKEKFAAWVKKIEQEEKEEFQQTLADLSCENRATAVTVGSAIRERPSVRLFFNAAKAKVCKPFAQ